MVVSPAFGNSVYTVDFDPTNHFSDTLRLYAEYISGGPEADSSYANYVFSDGGYVFGIDGNWIEYQNDSMRFRGILRPDSASLAAYSGQTIYIAFVHGTTDDNMLSIDDIRVTGNGVVASVNETKVPVGDISVYPNPASDMFRVAYANGRAGVVRLNMYDATGKLVKRISNAMQIRGDYFFDVETRELANGVYNVVLENADGKTSSKVTVQR